MARIDDLDLDHFHFRGLHPKICLGTASDRYAGWVGQIYSEERYRGHISSRSKTMGGVSFREEVLPVESVSEYFEHFRILEIDYTFYQPLLNRSGEPSQTHHVLRSYRLHMEEGDGLLLKVPQVVSARRILSSGRYIENPDFLNSDLFIHGFYEPAGELLGETLRGFIFEQEYHRKQDRLVPDALAKSLDAFFRAIPKDERYHIELRTEPYLTKPVFDVMETHGVGQVLSHWTWLPSLARQFARAGGRFFNSGRDAVIRLMTPIGTRYEDAYAKAHPFDKLVEGMIQGQMVEETVELISAAIDRGIRVNVIANNRAGGNAPLIARTIAERFLAVE